METREEKFIVKKKGISLIIVLITILSITACQRNPAPDILTNTADDNVKIEDKKRKIFSY